MPYGVGAAGCDLITRLRAVVARDGLRKMRIANIGEGMGAPQGGHGPPKILVEWATMRLTHPRNNGLYVR